MTLLAGTRLGPYEILSPLGAGGMGEVYRARDKKLDRDVAVKVLPQSVAADPDTLARFEREAKAVAALSHPNILAIHDFGTHEGTAYAVTELLEGETLRGKLAAGPIPQKQAVDYALQVVKGLSAAHEKGVVHRDLKPENLFVSRDGHLKILDFGLAKKVEPVAPGEETSAPTVSGHTEPGTVMGTVGYMSPEQVRGFAVDHRSDIFSFGAILYELLSGKKAFSRHTVADTISAILKEEPPAVSESGRNISSALDHIVKHCLEKDRDNRFQSARDIAFNLTEQPSPTVTSGVQVAMPRTGKRQAFVAAAILFVLAVAGDFLLRRTHKGGGEAGGGKRLAVLPFENLGAPEDDYFADGIADAVRGKLTSLPGVQVIARSSSTPYKKTTKTPKQIAQELDVGYLLTATVRWQKGTGGASRVEVSPELVEVASAGAPTSKWQQPFDAALTDVFQVQADIASRVAQGLGVALEAGERKRLSEKPTQNLAAYEAFLKGEETFIVATDAPAIRKALAFYEQAVALDPGFAQAWARVSEANSALSENGTEPGPTERAHDAAKRALALAPDRPEAYHALGDYQLRVALDSNRAIEQYARGLRLAPDNAELLTETATAELPLGRWDAAVEHLRRAERLDPLSVWPRSGLGTALLWLRRYPEAREAIDQALALTPIDIGLIRTKAMTFLADGDLAGARAVLSAAPKAIVPSALVAQAASPWVLDEQQRDLLLRLTPSAFDDDRGDWAINLAAAHALRGDAANVRTYAEEARKAFEEQVRAAPEDPVSRIFLGLSLAYLGRKQEAIREGERGAALAPMTKNVRKGAYLQHQLVRIYMLVGEPEKALDKLEPLLGIPGYLSPGWLKIDPNFDSLRTNPRFQKLVAGAK
jgi:serine/threonine protein kinase/tetratricopeptide (TPR) repeat protein